jgi:hypothetical protein
MQFYGAVQRASETVGCSGLLNRGIQVLARRIPQALRQLKNAASNSKECKAQANHGCDHEHSVSAPNPPQRGNATFAFHGNLARTDETPSKKNEETTTEDIENLEVRHLRFNVCLTGERRSGETV